MALIKIYSGSEIEVLAIEARLREAGIPALLKNNIQSGAAAGFATFGLGVDVFVEEEQADEARGLIENL
ncbi:hypothetical protein VF13_37670 [Nostoc linckia z16]|nr:hypothetical protein VF13_37670 [Nostoc linckia z16]